MKVKRTLPDVEKKFSAFFRANRRMPTYSEAAEIIGVHSKSVVHFWVKKMMASGLLQKDAKGFLSPARLSLGLPLAGEVCAGFPSPAEEELRDVISFDDDRRRNNGKRFSHCRKRPGAEKRRHHSGGSRRQLDNEVFPQKRQNGNAGGGQSQISANYPASGVAYCRRHYRGRQKIS